MTEQEYVEQQQTEGNKSLVRQLKQIQKKGFVKSKVQTETLLLARLIVLTPPTEEFRHNHYKLTEKGLEIVHA